MRKVILLFLMVVSIVWYVNKPLFEKEATFRSREDILREIEDRKTVGEPISVSEINSFLEVWPVYSNSWISRIGKRQLSLTTSKDANKRMPYLTRIWLHRKGWEVGRFFYVEERLKAIVKSIETDDRIAKTVDLLEKQYKAEKSETNKDGIKKIIEYQKSLSNIEKVTRNERDLVRPYLEEVSALLGVERL